MKRAKKAAQTKTSDAAENARMEAALHALMQVKHPLNRMSVMRIAFNLEKRPVIQAISDDRTFVTWTISTKDQAV